MPMFAPATRKKLKLRMAIDGPSGSGKTYTALRFAFALGKKVCAIDTEHKSMSKYRGESPDGIPWKWQVCELVHFDPANYTLVIQEARKLNPDVLIVDSLSHAWEGVGGALEQVSKASGNKYTAWKDVTPKHQRMVQAILSFPAHIIVTMRSKMDYVLEENQKGKMVPRKVGMAPVQRPGMEYEFDIVGEMDWAHNLLVTKTRCPALDGLKVEKPGPEFMQPVIAWLNDGEVVSVPSQRMEPGKDTVGKEATGRETTAAVPTTSAGLMESAFASSPVAQPPETAEEPRATADQIRTICELFEKLGTSATKVVQLLESKFDVSSVADLTSYQATQLINVQMKKVAAANPT